MREAQAKAAEKARQEAEANKPDNPFLKYVGMAETKAREEREQREEKERDDYWDERERRRER